MINFRGSEKICHSTDTYWSKVGDSASARSLGLCLDLEAASNTVLSRALDIRSPALLLTAEYTDNVTAMAGINMLRWQPNSRREATFQVKIDLLL